MKFFTRRRIVRVSRNRSDVFAVRSASDRKAMMSDSAGELMQKTEAHTGQQSEEQKPYAQETVLNIDERNGDT